MEKLISYHGQQSVKDKYIARYAMHRQMDAVHQGVGYENDGGVIRACFVGCTLQSYDHSRFPIELGWPEWLARLADTIFEGLPKKEAPQFGTDSLMAPPVGADLDAVKGPFLLSVQRRNLERLKDNAEPYAQQCRDAIQGVITWLEGGMPEAQLSAVRSAAYSAAESAYLAVRSAAYSAAESAYSAAESAAYLAAESAYLAVRSAAYSARSAADSARSAAYLARSAAYLAARSAADSAAESAYLAVRSAAYLAARSAADSADSAADSAARSAARSAAYLAARSAESQAQRDTLLSLLSALEAA